MANTRTSSKIQNQSSIDNEKNPLTIEGYLQIFESCENTFDASKRLQSLEGTNFPVNLLNSEKLENVSVSIFSYINTIGADQNSMISPQGYIKVIETLCLLENVFRNTLLQPHLPAYRTINMNCSRYRCYIDEKAKNLFETLGFRDNKDDLFTYIGIDRLTTVNHAVTCLCFWDWLSRKLQAHLNSQNQSVQQNHHMESTRV